MASGDLPSNWAVKAHYRLVLATVPGGRERDLFQLAGVRPHPNRSESFFLLTTLFQRYPVRAAGAFGRRHSQGERIKSHGPLQHPGHRSVGMRECI